MFYSNRGGGYDPKKFQIKYHTKKERYLCTSTTLDDWTAKYTYIVSLNYKSNFAYDVFYYL
jgi:hypothetical protein